MASRFYNLSTDNTLGGVSPSDAVVSSQKAIKDYIDDHSSSVDKLYFPDLFDWKWADHELDDMSWLRADTFSWQDGTVYEAAYNHLVDDFGNGASGTYYAWTNSHNYTVYTVSETPSEGDKIYEYDNGLFIWNESSINGGNVSYFVVTHSGAEIVNENGITYDRDTSQDVVISGSVAQTETIAGITITYYRSSDGHKIVLADQETNAAAIFSSTGVAWYYILDTANQRFKLPRTKFGIIGLRDGVGNYVGAGLPNITGVIGQYDCAVGTYNISRSGAFYAVNQNSRSMMYDRLSASNTYGDTGFDASRSNSIYGSSTTVQPPATQQYLYFYVGGFTKTAVQQTAGLNAELFNNKADLAIFNILYPVGAVYIGIQSTCPLASIIPGSTWSKIEGRYLLASGTIAGSSEVSSAGSYISAGLPNITGSFDTGDRRTHINNASGAFYRTSASSNTWGAQSTATGNTQGVGFDASRSNSIYGYSSTVRPAAYSVNVWVRTA